MLAQHGYMPHGRLWSRAVFDSLPVVKCYKNINSPHSTEAGITYCSEVWGKGPCWVAPGLTEPSPISRL